MPDGILLSGTRLHDILPASVRDDPVFMALAERLDETLAEEDARHPLILIWARIDRAEEPLLSNLAYQLHLDGYEGWHLAETLEQKRRLAKEAVILHFRKGTLSGLKKAFDILNMRGNVVEWWERPDDPAFEPYTFDFEVEASRLIDEKFYDDTLKLILELKNLRSHLRKFRVSLVSRGRVPMVASAMMGGTVVTIYPPAPKDIVSEARLPVVASAMQSFQDVVVHPLGEIQ